MCTKELEGQSGPPGELLVEHYGTWLSTFIIYLVIWVLFVVFLREGLTIRLAWNT